MSERECCGNCRFVGPGDHSNGYGGESLRTCRRHAPKMDEQWGHMISRFPQTDSGGWCGEYARAKADQGGGECDLGDDVPGYDLKPMTLHERLTAMCWGCHEASELATNILAAIREEVEAVPMRRLDGGDYYEVPRILALLGPDNG
jgi:hypothetical protein